MDSWRDVCKYTRRSLEFVGILLGARRLKRLGWVGEVTASCSSGAPAFLGLKGTRVGTGKGTLIFADKR
jgi:hypothetical protein